ncbi:MULTISPECIES: Lrp/AsnC family transcriptional regulator [Pseudomonas]|uniref:Lrp/AsnC family transcriptional regulator n=2 Tax=Pseudomonas TaxID=286 RepID=UPI001EEF971F|nr:MULTISPECIES: Lrp/AsnC family transcriptional regulator [unclassified Pseudomonas]
MDSLSLFSQNFSPDFISNMIFSGYYFLIYFNLGIKIPLKKPSLDASSLAILDALQANAELSNADLAELVGISTSPCWRRVSDLKQQGVLRGAVALVDPLKLGLAVNVFVHVTLKQQDKESLEVFTNAIQKRPEVMECYLMSGEADFMLRVVIEDLLKYQTLLLECLTQIASVASIRSSFALSQVKYTTALPTDHLRRK